MARRVYAGREPTEFVTGGIGHVEPGDLIDVPDVLLEAFSRRADIAVPPGEPEAAVAGAEEQAGRRRPAGKRPGGTAATEEQ